MTATARTELRRGACPGLSTPMQTGDGLLARLMPSGTITLDAMAGLAAAARTHGNRILELTSRGNIQVRGLTLESAPAFADAVAALGIPAHDGVPVIADPLAGLDPSEVIDASVLATQLRHHLVMAGLVPRIHAVAGEKDADGRDKPGHDGSGGAPALSPKISIAIDGGGQLHLDAQSADIRLRAVATPGGPRLCVSVGGDATTAAPLGTIAPADAMNTVTRLLREIASHGPDARGRDAVRIGQADGSRPVPRKLAEPIGRHRLRDHVLAVGIGFPFGHTDATTLDALIAAARAAGASGLRASPGRALLILGIAPDRAAPLVDAVGRLGFIVDPNDPRRRVVACAGAPICASGEIAARALAPSIADTVAPLLAPDEVIHLSGCAKGCAHHGRAALTVIGRDGACGLLIDGAAAGSCMTELLPQRLAELVRPMQPKVRHG
jgi:precorrin-3B synthase